MRIVTRVTHAANPRDARYSLCGMMWWREGVAPVPEPDVTCMQCRHSLEIRRPANRMKRVLVESPYAGDLARNLRYARNCVADSLNRGEAPYASHLFFPQVLDDLDPAERALGIEAGLVWGAAAELTAVYEDFGISPGMRQGIERAEREGRPVVYRTLSREGHLGPRGTLLSLPEDAAAQCWSSKASAAPKETK